MRGPNLGGFTHPPLVSPLIAKSILQNGCYEADSTTPRPNGPIVLLVYALELRRAREERQCLSVTHDTLCGVKSGE